MERAMCDCKEQIEGMLKERHAKNKPADRDHEAKLMGYGVGVTDSGLVQTSFMPAELYSTRTVKKTGLEKCVTTKINMHFSHCPFCGEKRTAA